MDHRTCAYSGVLLDGVRSAFQAESIAEEMAINWIKDSLPKYARSERPLDLASGSVGKSPPSGGFRNASGPWLPEGSTTIGEERPAGVCQNSRTSWCLLRLDDKTGGIE